eukprot:TRINITY_DN21383_c0_g1_i1.p1 TRINITY_DN21383_c0_g1~~TRINITY_DN21383_c0_g1_i1.p1  ORF type:complete len:333 (-),score=30.32 TRINITY_DN21383_c0_g1_i1:679-1677(-)
MKIRMVTYNCQAGSWLGRLRMILGALSFVQVIALQGTKILSKPFADRQDTYWTERISHYDVVHWPAACANYSNLSTGVSLAIDSRAFHTIHRADFFSSFQKFEDIATGAMAFSNWMTLPPVSKDSQAARSAQAQPKKKQRTVTTSESSHERASSSRDDPQRQLLSSMGQNVKHIEARLRIAEGEIRETFALMAEDDAAIAMMLSGVEYQNAVRESAHGRGRRWTYSFSALVRTLYGRENLPQELRALLENFMVKYDNPRKVGKVIRHSTAKLQRNRKYVTVTLRVKASLEPLIDAMINYLETQGAEVSPYDGPAPRGPLIRDLQTRMEQMHL